MRCGKARSRRTRQSRRSPPLRDPSSAGAEADGEYWIDAGLIRSRPKEQERSSRDAGVCETPGRAAPRNRAARRRLRGIRASSPLRGARPKSPEASAVAQLPGAETHGSTLDAPEWPGCPRSVCPCHCCVGDISAVGCSAHRASPRKEVPQSAGHLQKGGLSGMAAHPHERVIAFPWRNSTGSTPSVSARRCSSGPARA